MLVPRNPAQGPEVALQLEKAGDERARVVERAPRQIELVLAFLLLHLPAPDQLQVPRSPGPCQGVPR